MRLSTTTTATKHDLGADFLPSSSLLEVAYQVRRWCMKILNVLFNYGLLGTAYDLLINLQERKLVTCALIVEDYAL